MSDMRWSRLFLLGLALLASFWLLRLLLQWRLRRRIRLAWEGAARLNGIGLEAGDPERLPRLEGEVGGYQAVVAAERDDGPAGTLHTRTLVRLGRPSPVRLRIGRAGPLSLLGDLTRRAFHAGAAAEEERSFAEGDPELLRRILSGPLRELMGSFEDWSFGIEEDAVWLSTPGVAEDAARMTRRLALVAEVADLLRQGGPGSS